MLYTALVGLIIGALGAFLLASRRGRALVDAARHYDILMPHVGALMTIPLADQLAMLDALPDLNLDLLAPHLSKLMSHRFALVAALPKLQLVLLYCVFSFGLETSF